jgi:hypothetical protein
MLGQELAIKASPTGGLRLLSNLTARAFLSCCCMTVSLPPKTQKTAVLLPWYHGESLASQAKAEFSFPPS